MLNKIIKLQPISQRHFKNLLLVEQPALQVTRTSGLSNFLQLQQGYCATGPSLPANRFVGKYVSVCLRFMTASDGSNGIFAF